MHAHRGDMGRTMGRNVAEKVRDHPLRQVVGLDQVTNRQFLQGWHQPPMAPITRFTMPSWPKWLRPFPCRRLARQHKPGSDCRAARHHRVSPAGEKALFQRDGDFLGKANANKAASRDCIAVMDQGDGGFRRNNLSRAAAVRTNGRATVWGMVDLARYHEAAGLKR